MTETPPFRISPRGEQVAATRRVLFVGRRTGEARPRLDRYLCRRLKGLSRTYVQARIREGDVLVNGAFADAAKRLAPGDEILLVYGRDRDLPLVADDLPLAVLHEDDHLIAVDKPAGVPSQPRDRHKGGSLVNRLVHHLSCQAHGEYRAPGVLHRLDQDTTGVVLYTKSIDALRFLAREIRNRRIEKRYLAVVEASRATRPAADHFTVNAPIGRDPDLKERRMIRPDGKPSVTHVTVLERWGDLALVSALLETGRTHQIRLHLAHAGHPIVGDRMYGGRAAFTTPEGRTLLARQALHAHRLVFTHPATRAPFAIEAPLPADLAGLLDHLRE